MKFIALVILLFSSICHAESDVVVAQKNTMLVSYNTFQTTEGGERRVVEFSKPSIHHFFTYSNNQIFMNSVADKQKNLRQVRFTNNQFEIDAFSAKKDTPLSWTLDNVKTVLAKSDAVIQQTPVEARSSRVLIEELPRGCGNVQVLGVLSDDKSHIKSYAVKVAGMGEMHINAHVEGVSCDDKTLVVGTLRCDSEKGPCYQNLVGVQFTDDDQFLSDSNLIKMVYGNVDDRGAIVTADQTLAESFVRILLTRYVETNNRKLFFVVSQKNEYPGKNSYCTSCAIEVSVSILESIDGEWNRLDSEFEQIIYGWPYGEYYIETLGRNNVGIVFLDRKDRGGEGTFDFSIFKIDKTKVTSVLQRNHYYNYNSFCPVSKSTYSKVELIKNGDMYDVKLKLGHYNNAKNCKKMKFMNEEQIYRFSESKYKLIKESVH